MLLEKMKCTGIFPGRADLASVFLCFSLHSKENVLGSRGLMGRKLLYRAMAHEWVAMLPLCTFLTSQTPASYLCLK